MNRPRKHAVLYILAAGFLIVLVGVLLFLWLYFSSMREMHLTTRKLYEQPFAVANAAQGLQSQLHQLRSQVLLASQATAEQQGSTHTQQWMLNYQRSVAASLAAMQHRHGIAARTLSALQQTLTALERETQLLLSALAQTPRGSAQSLQRRQQNWQTHWEHALAQTSHLMMQANHYASQTVNESQQRLQQHTNQGLMYAGMLLVVFLLAGLLVGWRIYQLHLEADKFAYTDFLTGIANRRHFMQALAAEIQRAQRYQVPFSFAMVDIDHFKKINDQYGHLTGDLVLQNFCLRCKNALRNSDSVGRLGGEEFGILMPMTELHEAARVIERLRAEIDHSVLNEQGQQIHYTASFGLISTAQLLPQANITQWMKLADAALYSAKQQGRNRVFIANH